MAESTAYAASGGWSGGAPLSTGGVLSNYYQKLQSVNPSSGSLSVSQPAQASAQPSSLARAVTTTQATPTQPAAQPATQQVPTLAVALPTVSRAVLATPVATPAPVRTGVIDTSAAQAPAGFANGATADITAAATAKQAGATHLAAATTFGGPKVILSQDRSNPSQIRTNITRFDPVTGKYVDGGYTYQSGRYIVYVTETGQQLIGPAAYNALESRGINQELPTATFTNNIGLGTMNASQLTSYANTQNAAALTKYAADKTTAQSNADAANASALATYTDQNNAAAAQDAAERASAFNLAGALQAPNTTKVDEAGRNDLNRIASQYGATMGGADAAAYNYAGQQAQTTQNAVNTVNHQTAYANAFNQNYQTFANALAGQQAADANASDQKLTLDMQGVGQAVQTLQQQASQLDAATQTRFNATLIPLQKLLRDYDIYVKTYGQNGRQTLETASSILAMAGQLATSLV